MSAISAGVGFSYFQEILRGPETGGFNRPGNVEHGVALGHDDGVEIHVTAAKALLDIDDIGRLVEEIFAGFEGSLAAKVAP